MIHYDAAFVFDEWWHERFSLASEKQSEIAVALCGFLICAWGTLYLISRRAPYKTRNKQLFGYLTVLSLPLLISQLLKICFFHLNHTAGNFFCKMFVLLLTSMRLGIITIRLYISHVFFGPFVLITWYGVTAFLHVCIIFPHIVARALPDQEQENLVHFGVKAVYSIMVLFFHAGVCSVKLNFLRLIMALTVFLPNGTIDFITECELWFVLNTCLGTALFSQELCHEERKLSQRNSRLEPLVLAAHVRKQKIKAKLRKLPAPGRLDVVKPGEIYKSKAESVKKTPPASLLALKQEYGISVVEPQSSLEDKFEDKKYIDCGDYTSPDFGHNNRLSISLSPSSLDRGPIYEASATGALWENVKNQPWSDEPGLKCICHHSAVCPIRDEMATINPHPEPTAHPTMAPTASYMQAQRIKTFPNKPPTSRRSRGRSFSPPSLSDKRNEDLIPRRRNAHNRRQLVIKMIDEIILGNESLIGPDQHTVAYDEFISPRGLENAPQSHV